MSRAAFQWADPFLLDQQLTDDERMIRDMLMPLRSASRLTVPVTLVSGTISPPSLRR